LTVLLLRTHRYGAFWHNSDNATVISVSYSLSDRYNSTSRGPWTFLVFFSKSNNWENALHYFPSIRDLASLKVSYIVYHQR